MDHVSDLQEKCAEVLQVFACMPGMLFLCPRCLPVIRRVHCYNIERMAGQVTEQIGNQCFQVQQVGGCIALRTFYRQGTDVDRCNLCPCARGGQGQDATATTHVKECSSCQRKT